jgi:cell division transport system ATP-binding protein
VIELQHVWVQYQKPHWALSDVSLTIQRGEFCTITGPSGSGKTTLLRTLTRELVPTHGQVFIAGKNIGLLPSPQVYLLRRVMGIVFQDFRLLFHKRVFDNVAIALQVQGVPVRDLKRRVFIALRMVAMHHRIWDFPSELSYGEQQRVAVARALANGPRLLLADEPTGNLDWKTGEFILQLVLELHRRRGLSSILVTHSDRVARYCGKVFELEQGRLKRIS